MTIPAPPAPPGEAELSCYTTNLVAHLRPWLPDVDARLAHAVRLAVRTDAAGTGLAFSQHRRIDRTADGRELGYRSAADWASARAGLAAEAAEAGRVLAVGNTRLLPWSPAYGREDVPHWVLLEPAPGGGPGWWVTDHFAALLPHGEQRPYSGPLDEDGLRAALTPVPHAAPETTLRDVHALGTAVPLPDPAHYRWLAWQPAAPEPPREGEWLADPMAALEFLAARLGADEQALARNTDDLWAAARHHRHRLSTLADAGLLPRAPALAAAASWSELPRSLRFAAASAERGRPRPGVVARAFHDVITTMARLAKEDVSR